MAIQKVFSSLSKKANISTYVGEAGRLFYDTQNGQLRLSNGTTPGGVAVSISANVVVSESLVPEADNVYSIGTESLRWNHIHLGDGGIYFDGASYPTPQTVPFLPGTISSSLIPTTDNGVSLGSPNHRYANAYLGTQGLFLADSITDQNINIVATDGTLYLNGAQNLAVGNLTIVDTTLTSSTSDRDISIGAVDDTGFFYIKRKAQFDNTSFGPTEPMVSLNASGGADPATIFPDTVLQSVGRPNKNSRFTQRSYGSTGTVGGDNSYSVWGSYVARGNVSNPSAIKANDILSRISSNGYGTSTWGSGGTRIESIALENFTDSAKGSKINFWTTPTGSIVSQLVASVNSVGLVANGIQFSTDSTIQTTAGIPLTQKGVATGVATLGVDGRLTTEQIPSSLSGAQVFQGGWNASTNTPTLSNGTGTTGYQYIVTTPGNRNLGAGNVAYASGDTITYGGGVWNYVQGSSPISSVSGNLHMVVGPTTGAVVIGVDATPNVTAGTIVSRDASGNFQANTITAALSGQATSAVTAATVTAGAQTAITSVGTLTSLAVTGNVTTGNVSGTKATFTTLDGTLSTGAQAAITNVGTLGSLTVTGNITAGNVTIGTTTYSNLAISSTALAADFTIGVTGATGNLILNRTTVMKKDAYVTGNIYVGANSRVTTPKVIINDGGIRTISGGTTCTIDFAVDSIILWTAPSGTAAITLSNYTPGATVKLIIALTTTRDVTYGISSAANSSTGADNWNGAGAGAVDISNTAMHLNYTCITGVASGCYVGVTVN